MGKRAFAAWSIALACLGWGSALAHAKTGELPAWFPPVLVKQIQKLGHHDIVERARAIQTVSPEEFIALMEAQDARFLGGGYNGVALSGSDAGAGASPSGTFKVSHLAFFHPDFVGAWKRLHELPAVQAIPDSVWEGKLGDGKITMADLRAALGRGTAEDQAIVRSVLARLENARPSVRELVGALIWSHYDPHRMPLPRIATSDGMGYLRPYIDGESLADILKSEREKSELHRKYSMAQIWRDVVAIQDAAEQMLLDYGGMIDLVVPGNLIALVDKKAGSSHARAVDPETIEPTAETHRYYAKLGFKIADFNYFGEAPGVRWPLMPNHIISSVHWGLSYEQALDYMAAYWHLRSRGDVVSQIAQTPRWNISMFPGMNRYSNIRRAWRERHPVSCTEELEGLKDSKNK